MQEGCEKVMLCFALAFPRDFNGVWEPYVLSLGHACDSLHKDGMMHVVPAVRMLEEIRHVKCGPPASPAMV